MCIYERWLSPMVAIAQVSEQIAFGSRETRTYIYLCVRVCECAPVCLCFIVRASVCVCLYVSMCVCVCVSWLLA